MGESLRLLLNQLCMEQKLSFGESFSTLFGQPRPTHVTMSEWLRGRIANLIRLWRIEYVALARSCDNPAIAMCCMEYCEYLCVTTFCDIILPK